MDCSNHPGVAAVNRCSGCAESFCGNCLVQILGNWYCGSCKTMTVSAAPPLIEEATIPCKEATEALTFAIISIFCLGPVLGTIALVKASQARKLIAMNPRLAGSGKVTAAFIIAPIAILLWLIGFLGKLAKQ